MMNSNALTSCLTPTPNSSTTISYLIYSYLILWNYNKLRKRPTFGSTSYRVMMHVIESRKHLLRFFFTPLSSDICTCTLAASILFHSPIESHWIRIIYDDCALREYFIGRISDYWNEIKCLSARASNFVWLFGNYLEKWAFIRSAFPAQLGTTTDEALPYVLLMSYLSIL